MGTDLADTFEPEKLLILYHPSDLKINDFTAQLIE